MIERLAIKATVKKTGIFAALFGKKDDVLFSSSVRLDEHGHVIVDLGRGIKLDITAQQEV